MGTSRNVKHSGSYKRMSEAVNTQGENEFTLEEVKKLIPKELRDSLSKFLLCKMQQGYLSREGEAGFYRYKILKKCTSSQQAKRTVGAVVFEVLQNANRVPLTRREIWTRAKKIKPEIKEASVTSSLFSWTRCGSLKHSVSGYLLNPHVTVQPVVCNKQRRLQAA